MRETMAPNPLESTYLVFAISITRRTEPSLTRSLSVDLSSSATFKSKYCGDSITTTSLAGSLWVSKFFFESDKPYSLD